MSTGIFFRSAYLQLQQIPILESRLHLLPRRAYNHPQFLQVRQFLLPRSPPPPSPNPAARTHSWETSPGLKLSAVPVMTNERLTTIRSYAKEASPPALPPLKGDEMLKNIFYEVKNKFDIALGILKKEKITIDPDDPAAVSHYAKLMKIIREKADLYSDSQRIKSTIELKTRDIPDARTYLLTLQEIRIKGGLFDELGAEKLMMEALEKIESEIKKPLLRSDKKNMALLQAEFDKVNKKLGIKKEDLPKYEEDLELKIAKAELEELKRDAVEAMEAQLKR
ncbi:hypothetical protein KSP39_PZI018248 [Platanthera zijinensis]|uniref:ATP synthase 24 kDa subunit, mitochondrial n=1 Tax=Platanthera zijinensis TaxID=2320716 RepID=A0AAP0B4W2_9ASPA